MKALVVEPVRRPDVHLTGTQVTAALLDEQAFQSPCHVPVERDELVRRVAGAEVAAPSPQEQVESRDGLRQPGTDPSPTGEGLDLRSRLCIDRWEGQRWR